MSKFCENCGYQLEDEETFCPQCGMHPELMQQQPFQNQTPLHQQQFQSQGTYDHTMNPQEPYIVEPNQNSMIKYSKIGIILVSILLILATLLPYVKVMDTSFNLLFTQGKPGDGIFFCIFAAICIVFTYLNKKVLVVVCNVLELLFCFYKISEFDSAISSLGILSSIVSKGVGYYVLLIASIALLIISTYHLCVANKAEKSIY